MNTPLTMSDITDIMLGQSEFGCPCSHWTPSEILAGKREDVEQDNREMRAILLAIFGPERHADLTAQLLALSIEESDGETVEHREAWECEHNADRHAEVCGDGMYCCC